MAASATVCEGSDSVNSLDVDTHKIGSVEKGFTIQVAMNWVAISIHFMKRTVYFRKIISYQLFITVGMYKFELGRDNNIVSNEQCLNWPQQLLKDLYEAKLRILSMLSLLSLVR